MARSAHARWRQNPRRQLEVSAVSLAGIAATRLLGTTLRIEAPWFGMTEVLRRGGRGVLIAMWHGPHFPILWAYRGCGIYVMTSHSADGEILTRVLRSLGYRCFRGSSSRGGQRAMIEMARSVRGGADVAVAVDGPRGPRYQAKAGILLLAKLTGAWVLPVAAGLDRFWQINSWDRYRLPKPLSRAQVLTGEPLAVARDADDAQMERLRRWLEGHLWDLQIEADRRVGCGKPLERGG